MPSTKLLCSRFSSRLHAGITSTHLSQQFATSSDILVQQALRRRQAKPINVSNSSTNDVRVSVTIGAAAAATAPVAASVPSTFPAAAQRREPNRPQHPLLSALLQRIDRSSRRYRSMATPKDIFQGVLDRFKGITVDCHEEFVVTAAEFEDKLNKSLEYWIANKNRAIWFNIYKEQSHWVPILAKAGFDFHHARTGVVTMYRWLPTDESYNLPAYAHTLLGCGAVVINAKNEVLVVSDRYALIKDSWKLPGGYIEPQENVIDGAIREVREETGIEATFRTMISWRHSHNGNFGCSDMYVVVALEPQSLEIKLDEREIAKARWMPVHEYLQHPQVHETNRHFVRTFLDYEGRGLKLTCLSGVHKILQKEYNLYFVQPTSYDSNDEKDITVAEIPAGLPKSS